MKELLIATDSFLPRWDGVARFLSEVIPRLSGSYKITVVAPDFRGRKIKIPKVRIVRIPLQKRTIGDYTPSILDLRKIKRLVETSDIIFTQSIGPIGGPAVYYGQKLKKKVVAFMHSVEWELVSKSVKKYKKSTYHIVKRFARYLYRRCNVVIVPSHHIKTDLEQENIKTKTRIIHVGTDSGWFKPGIKSKAKKKLGIKGDRFVIGFVGRVGREKNLETLEKAFFKLRKKYDHLELLIVGTGLKEDIQRLRKKGVRVMGSQDHVLPFYQAMDVHVLPSLTETSSISTIEAMACGLPVIVTPVGFLKEYIKSGVNGLVFRTQQVDQLVKKIELLLHNDDLRKRLGKNARITIKERFTWGKTVKKLRKVLG